MAIPTDDQGREAAVQGETCETCGQTIAIGSWPWCPHGEPHGNAIQTDESFIGGQTLENLGHEPVTVYSRTEFKQAMARANVEQRIKHVPGDKVLQDFGAFIDPQTLANARALVSRQGERKPQEEEVGDDVAVRFDWNAVAKDAADDGGADPSTE